MDKPTVYFSSNCQDTPAFKATLAALQVDCTFIDIIESMKNLKQFLRLRDNEAAFLPIKENGYAGVPVLITPDKEYLFTPEDLKKYYQDPTA